MKTNEELEKLTQEIRNLKIENGNLATQNEILKGKVREAVFNLEQMKKEEKYQAEEEKGQEEEPPFQLSYPICLDAEHRSKLAYIATLWKEPPQTTLNEMLDKAYLTTQIVLANLDVFKKMSD
ncbi:MAG: hypothetical protein M1542_08395 [Thermotogae bacterium]|jgi:hypothetical protein|nr:hypothetical protein [Thermotogota bacterium]MCL5033247.1 hypothetical protein [Thermotogota bacterium]